MPAAAPARRRTATRAIVALVLVVVALSAVVRLVNLDVFPTLVFDEHYYVHDAGSIIHGRIGPRQPSPWKPGDGRSLAHPPLGTLSIAAGILALGDGPWGWRVPSAVAGTLLIALVYPLARRLGLAPPWALAALLLAASDTMLIVESRIGVLDPFVALWSAVCIYCALRYVQSGRPPLWLVLTGISGGLALASKWSGALALAAAVAIVALDWWRRRRARRRAGAGDEAAAQFDPRAAAGEAAGFAGRLAGGAACLVALPLAVYVASYADYFASGHTLRQWLHLQGYMATFNWNVQGSAAASSRPLTWIFDATPIWYRWAETPHGVAGPDRDRQPAAVVGLDRRLRRPAVAGLEAARCTSGRSAASGRDPLPALAGHEPPVVHLLPDAGRALPRHHGGHGARPPRRPRSAARPLGGVLPLPWAPCSWAVAAGGTLAWRLAALAALVAVLAAAVFVLRRRRTPAQRPAATAGDAAPRAASPGGGPRRLAVHRRRGRPGRRLAAVPGLVWRLVRLLRAPGLVDDLALRRPAVDRQPINAAMIAFWACRRFSAWSKTTDCGL